MIKIREKFFIFFGIGVFIFIIIDIICITLEGMISSSIYAKRELTQCKNNLTNYVKWALSTYQKATNKLPENFKKMEKYVILNESQKRCPAMMNSKKIIMVNIYFTTIYLVNMKIN